MSFPIDLPFDPGRENPPSKLEVDLSPGSHQRLAKRLWSATVPVGKEIPIVAAAIRALVLRILTLRWHMGYFHVFRPFPTS